jgi:YVTN family beta-propeller protein
VITHWHPDHALGVVCLGDRSFEVLAHPMTRRRLAEQGAQQANRLAREAPDSAEAADFAGCRIELPDQIVEERRVVDLGGLTVEIFHPGAAHTQGDLAVWSAEDRFLVTGDLFMHQASPSMGEGSAIVWVDVLNGFIDLAPEHVVAGHFGPSTPSDLERFRDYMAAQVERVGAALAAGVSPEEIGGRVDFRDFRDFGQFPQYGATFSGNAEAVARELMARPAGPGETNGFEVVARLDVGLNPHQIAFSADGGTAYVAAAGSDRVAVVDVATSRLVRTIAVEGTPLGVALLPGGEEMAVTRFQKNEVARFALRDGAYLGGHDTGVGASLIIGPLPDGRWLISVEQTDELLIMDPGAERAERVYSVGDRPFPPAATSDGRLAFVPGYDDGTVTVIDLWNGRVLDTVEVGANPSGGVVLPGDIEYAVAVRGEDRIVFINTASRRVVGSLMEGIGDSPFSVVLSTDGRLAFVNNTATHDISVIALPEKRVIARIPIGEQPIVMAAHPSGETLFVSSEGSHELSIIRIPDRWLRQPRP